MSTFNKHELAIAKKTMKMTCVMARIMGGPDHVQASLVIRRLTGNILELPQGCTCKIVLTHCPQCWRQFANGEEEACPDCNNIGEAH